MRYIIFVFFISFSFTSQAQDQLWTLQRCIQHAFNNNLTIKQSELTKQIYDNNYTESKLSLLPTVSADASQNFSFGNSVDPTTFEFVKVNTNSNSFGLTASVPLFTGLQQINGIRKSKTEMEAAQQDVLNVKDQIVLSVTTYFLNVLLNKAILTSANKQIETTSEQYKNTQKLIDAGALPQGDLLDIEAQLASDELRITQAENNLTLAKLSLQILLQLDLQNEFEVIAPAIDDPNPDVPVIYDPQNIYYEAVTKRPEIKAEELRLKSAQISEQIARGALYPTLSLSTSIRTNYFSEGIEQVGSDSLLIPPLQIGYLESDATEGVLSLPQTEFFPIIQDKGFGDQLKDNRSESVGISLSVPIFGGWSRMTNVQNAKLSTQISKYSLMDSKNALREEINQAYTNAVAAAKTFASAKKSYVALEKSFEYAEEKYKLGSLNSLDYLTVKNRLAITESDLLTAKYDYIFKLKILDFYAGNPITLD
ncbi:MAG: TolC family protein [Chitinophagales bacterium]|nr:TolC family protein [Chitinophagales bacterium]